MTDRLVILYPAWGITSSLYSLCVFGELGFFRPQSGLVYLGPYNDHLTLGSFFGKGGGGRSVCRARDSWWGGPGFDSCCGRPLRTGWVGVSIMWPAETEVMVSPLLCRVWHHVKLSYASLGTRPRYSLVVDKEVKKPNKPNQTRMR